MFFISTQYEIDQVVLVGAGGYGGFYLDTLLTQGRSRGVELTGVADPQMDQCRHLPDLKALNIPTYGGLKEFFVHNRCDLAIISSPIHLHAPLTCLALDYGSHVLCEKPLCATLEDVRKMHLAEKAAGKTVTVGFQWSFSPAIQALKIDIMAERLGRARCLRTLALTPRGDNYYRRNQWAGRRHTSAGEPIFDNPVNNATAHFLHNMLYLLGPEIPESATLKSLTAELWRANPIENYDTAALR